MSNKDRLRFQQTGMIFRDGKYVPAVEPQTPKEVNSQELIIQYLCNNCNGIMPKERWAEHEASCPPKDGHYASYKEVALRKAMSIQCKVCKSIMPLYRFEEHIKECKGKNH